MSKTIITKKLTIIALIVISFIIIIAIAFAPLFFIKQIIFKDVGNVAPEIIYIQNYNPFAPRIYWINEDTGSSTKNVVYAQLTRTGIWSFDGFDPLDQVTGKNLQKQNFIVVGVDDISTQDLINKLKTEDLSKNTELITSQITPQDIQTRQVQIDEYTRLKVEEDKLPTECKLKEVDVIGNGRKFTTYLLDKFLLLSTQFEVQDTKKSFPIQYNDVSGVFDTDSKNIYSGQYKLSDPQYPKIKLIQLYFGDMTPKKLIKAEDKLVKIFVVLQDCTRIEVPTKPDGTFDFEVVKNQWE